VANRNIEYPFHQAIYQIRPDLKAVVHAHPPALVSFSIVRQIPNTNLIPQAKNVCGPIGYAKYRIPGSKALGDEIADQFARDFKAVIMENHGAVLGGSDVIKAYERFEALEFCSRTLINSSIIGTPSFLTDAQLEEFDRQIPHNLPESESVVKIITQRE